MPKKISQEQLMVDILQKVKHPLTLNEIVEEISRKHPSSFKGKTPTKSLYASIFKNEKRRIDNGKSPLFKTFTRGGAKYFLLYTMKYDENDFKAIK